MGKGSGGSPGVAGIVIVLVVAIAGFAVWKYAGARGKVQVNADRMSIVRRR